MSFQQGSYTDVDSRYTYVLRIQVDPSNNGRVSRISGDLFLGKHSREVYKIPSNWFICGFESHSIEQPDSETITAKLTVEGTLEKLNSDPPNPVFRTPGNVRLSITESGQLSASLTILGSSHAGEYKFAPSLVSTTLREIAVETDYVVGIAETTVLEKLRIETARIAEARSIRIRPSKGNTFVADTASSRWEERDLRHALENNFRGFRPDNMGWRVYMLIAPEFARNTASSRTYGIMFDRKSEENNDDHNRQGAAVFWTPIQQRFPDDFERNFKRTYLHELGHTFNLIHTAERSSGAAQTSLSVMNYPDEFGAGSEEFLRRFDFSFDDAENQFLYHGHHQQVVMGGFRFSSSNYLKEKNAVAPERPTDWLRLTIRPSGGRKSPGSTNRGKLKGRDSAPELYRFGEPVVIEVKLESLHREKFDLPDVLSPSHRRVHYLIEKPNRKIVRYHPRIVRCGDRRTLQVPTDSPQLYERVTLSHGCGEPIFDSPGRYLIQASMATEDGNVVSNPLRISIMYPTEAENNVLDLLHQSMESRVASYLYCWGDPSDTAAISILEEIGGRLKGEKHGLVEDFQRCRAVSKLQGLLCVDESKSAIIRKYKSDEALTELTSLLGLTEKYARNRRKGTRSALDNMTYSHSIRLLTTGLSKAGEKSAAESVAVAGLTELRTRGIGTPVLRRIANSWPTEVMNPIRNSQFS